MTAVLDRDLTVQPSTEPATAATVPAPGVCLVRLLAAGWGKDDLGKVCQHSSGSCKPEGCSAC